MKIIYCCFGGAHSSVVTASIHLGYLPIDRIPTKEEILMLPFYDSAKNSEIGTPRYMGVDIKGNRVYFLGLGHARNYYMELLHEFYKECNIGLENDIIVTDVTILLNFFTRLGGFMSRKLNMVSIGRPLTVYGILKKYPSFVELVKNVKKTLI